MTRQAAIDAILKELDRATAKFPTWPDDPIHAAAIVNEEAGELVKACLEATYEKGFYVGVAEEAIQVGAMAIRFLMSHDRYRFPKCEQHAQGRLE